MIVTIDFETFYDQNYSLRKMSEIDYIMDERFETIMCAIRLGDAPTRVYVGEPAVRQALTAIDWTRHAALSHNMRFDGAILAWRYGIYPSLYLDTLGMANAITRPAITYSSLDALAKHFGLPPKGTAVHDMKGRSLASLSSSELKDYAAYCQHDTDLCREIFDRFMRTFPRCELGVVDLSLRMFIQPQAELNPIKLAEHLHMVRAEKEAAFARVSGIPRDVFSSNLKFAELLRSYGIEPPMKISPATGEETLALARNDRAFKELVENPELEPDVQAALAMRMGAKSTIEETRAATLLNLSQRGMGMPVPYKYFGAHTGRFSGDGGYNFANLKRGSPLRDAIEAKPGYRVVHRDSSQIEARLVAWLAGCDYLVRAFGEGRDVYSEFATRFYGRDVTKADKLERFTGKTAILSLGYGAGAAKFRHALYIGQGGVSVSLSEEQAQELVSFYRRGYPQIPELWKRGNRAINRMIRPDRHPDPAIPVIELGERCVYLPNGTAIQYAELSDEPDPDYPGGRRATYRGAYTGRRKIYGAKFIENVTQALARIVVTDIMLRVRAATGHRPFMSTYDSHDYVVAETDVSEFDTMLEREFSVTPAWAPDLPLASEGGFGRTLLQAEQGVNT